ncbi:MULTISPECIES: hypothetical protein, partial [unclassified Streptomyces]|uniref:hypothetical protein n=1 Tax=unclassified Streptomyces TaxID=2593676 RepID=UPI00404358E0
HGKLQIMSNDEYVARFGVKKALEQGVPLPAGTPESGPLLPRRDPSVPWYHIYWSTLDWEHRDIPTRHGNNDFGQHHSCTKHNMCGKHAINAPYNGKPDGINGTRLEYIGVVTDGESVRMVTTSSAEEGEKGPGGVHTPDGRPIGTVTAFCRGQTVCPDWVNNL